MSNERPQHDAGCHCGTVRFRVRLTDEFNTIRRCSCSDCRMRGAIAASAQLSDIEFIQGEDNLVHYQFHTCTVTSAFLSNTNHEKTSRCS
ncbi:GFA family protein [Rhizobium leguminosarum]|uniref:GFA family protein n=1 Tax=Rhizobium leguminosarum TaxID=384 RepID=UPI0026C92862